MDSIGAAMTYLLARLAGIVVHTDRRPIRILGAYIPLPRRHRSEDHPQAHVDRCLPPGVRGRLDGWSNVGCYFFGNFAPSRGLRFDSNKHGKSNIFGILALSPAYLFGVLGLWALGELGWSALRSKPELAETVPSLTGQGAAQTVPPPSK
jgi:hypothetical protein